MHPELTQEDAERFMIEAATYRGLLRAIATDRPMVDGASIKEAAIKHLEYFGHDPFETLEADDAAQSEA